MHQLVIQFPLRSIELDAGQLEALIAIESNLERMADGRFEVDGHDVGAGEMNIFIITADAIMTFGLIADALPSDPPWRAGFRNLDSEDYFPLCPPGLANFDVR